ncbi:MAG: hypothetical protein WDW36_001030 [Sanguina aurantia]
MERVVGLVNKLQQIASALGDTAASENSVLWNKLTTIVVIGGQSSGKSSVLEAVVGRDFLPRGTGIVTRRPLVLQLVKVDDLKALDFGEFAHAPGRRFSNFDDITREIEVETERHLAKTGGKVVSADPIYLTVHSVNVPNLTLVDMPGLTKVPIDGQPASIVQELDDMARMYVKGDNAIILAVSPANADLATSDALRMARDVDPSGDRTIGVLTKVDIMDRGTDCRDVLQGKTLKLKHGWVAVVNRGQADLNSKVSMKDARSREKDFFLGQPAYADLANVGTTYLAEKLSTHLIGEIMKNLPSMVTYIDSRYVGSPPHGSRAESGSRGQGPQLCTQHHMSRVVGVGDGSRLQRGMGPLGLETVQSLSQPLRGCATYGAPAAHPNRLSAMSATSSLSPPHVAAPVIDLRRSLRIKKLQDELSSLGGDVGGSRGSMLYLILTMIQKVERAFERIVQGGKDGGDKILDVFDLKLKEAIAKLPFNRILTLKNVQMVVNEADGYQPHIIAPENGYRRLIEDGLALLRDPAFAAVEQVHQIMKNIVTLALATPECRDVARFFNLKSELIAHASAQLEKLRKDSDTMVRTLVDMEASYLSATFFREIVAAESYAYDPSRPRPVFTTLNGENLFEKRYDNLPAGDAHLQRISDHVSAYLQIVRNQLLATVPKAIVHCMVVPAKATLLAAMLEEVVGKEEVMLRRLINESEEVAKHRDDLRKRLVLLQKAQKEITAFI